MKAARIHTFGSPEVLVVEDIPTPSPASGEVLIRVNAAGVGPWDAWIREHKSQVSVTLPIALGSDLAGTIAQLGSGVSGFQPGEPVYGVTNPLFVGAYAQLAVAKAGMIARKPATLTDVEAASVPVVAVTAWQMLFEYAKVKSGQTVLIQGAGGNVGAYAVQLAKSAGLRAIATASAQDVAYVKSLGADQVYDYRATPFETQVSGVDAVLDLVGGETRRRSFEVLKPGGSLVSAVSPIPPEEIPAGIHATFFLVEVTTARLNALTQLFEQHHLSTRVGAVLPLDQVRAAHEMLAGAPHPRGKIVLRVNHLA
ncbi:MAG TPA: NADP-dependent oxidoreductase [Candidatus Eisenbacteria bacterium]|nr:NADP-dependent oxidoreductase [Candidatus Eisenbacteria bacterium]